MAKLKIADNDDPNKPSKEGYINVANNLILKEEKFYEFVFAEPDERADLIQAAAGADAATPPRPCVVKHQLPNGSLEAISSANCKVVGERDYKKKAGKSKVTVPIPDTRPTDLSYLKGYAEIIHALYNTANPADKDLAHKFMFGMMLLTRCR